jgi:glycosyltransferase involved in cell wall biosynthesis
MSSTSADQMNATFNESSPFPLRQREVCVIGPLPPPCHGFAQATSDVAAYLEGRGFRVNRVDVKPIRSPVRFLSRLSIRLTQLSSVIVAVWKGFPIYVGLSGGRRQFIDLLFLAIARLGRVKLYVHHHSFAYLDKPTFLAKLCILVAGNMCVHIVLCASMKNRLQSKYRHARTIEIVSNAGLPSVQRVFKPRMALRKIGFLSAVSREKGIVEFLKVASALRNDCPALEFSIAGPCNDKLLLMQIETECRSHPNLRYVGPVYGSAKDAYIDSLDLLLFPTRYRHEADPLVVWETMSAGVPILAWERGCLKEALSNCSGRSTVIPKASSYVAIAVSLIRSWHSTPDSFRALSIELASTFSRASEASLCALDRVFMCAPRA